MNSRSCMAINFDYSWLASCGHSEVATCGMKQPMYGQRQQPHNAKPCANLELCVTCQNSHDLRSMTSVSRVHRYYDAKPCLPTWPKHKGLQSTVSYEGWTEYVFKISTQRADENKAVCSCFLLRFVLKSFVCFLLHPTEEATFSHTLHPPYQLVPSSHAGTFTTLIFLYLALWPEC